MGLTRTVRFQWERELLKSKLPASARLVGLVLATKADKDGTIPGDHSPSLTKLEQLTGFSRRGVMKSLNLLESSGWVWRGRPSPRAARANHERTKYALTYPKVVGNEVPQGRERGAPEVGNEVPKPRERGAHKPALLQTIPDQASSRAREVGSILDGAGLAEHERQEFLEFIRADRPERLVPYLHERGELGERVAEFRGAGSRRRPAGYAERQDEVLRREREWARRADAAPAADLLAVASVDAEKVIEAELIDDADDPWATHGDRRGRLEDPFAITGRER